MTGGNSSHTTAGAPNRDEWKALYTLYNCMNGGDSSRTTAGATNRDEWIWKKLVTVEDSAYLGVGIGVGESEIAPADQTERI